MAIRDWISIWQNKLQFSHTINNNNEHNNNFLTVYS